MLAACSFLVSTGSPTESDEGSDDGSMVVHVCVWDIASGSVAADGVFSVQGEADGDVCCVRWCPWARVYPSSSSSKPATLARQFSADSAVTATLDGEGTLHFVLLCRARMLSWRFNPSVSSLRYEAVSVVSDVRAAELKHPAACGLVWCVVWCGVWSGVVCGVWSGVVCGVAWLLML